ncbi:transposase [Nonomuraea sp. B10E15]|uniref:transposase n=1 Tax=Nonomuraea sp. B10E15 TaxID=3153560 RepID=UPI00325E1D7D
MDWARDTLRTTLEIVRKPADRRGVSVISRRWVVERTLAWLTACRRLARDYKRDPAVSEAIIRWAAIAGMARRLTRGSPAQRQSRYICD